MKALHEVKVWALKKNNCKNQEIEFVVCAEYNWKYIETRISRR